jgi:hypothetical protein
LATGVRAAGATGLRTGGALFFGSGRRTAAFAGAGFFGLVLFVPGFLPGIGALLIHDRPIRDRPF